MIHSFIIEIQNLFCHVIMHTESSCQLNSVSFEENSYLGWILLHFKFSNLYLDIVSQNRSKVKIFHQFFFVSILQIVQKFELKIKPNFKNSIKTGQQLNETGCYEPQNSSFWFIFQIKIQIITEIYYLHMMNFYANENSVLSVPIVRLKITINISDP